MLKHNGCTCFDALDPVCSPANIQPAGDFCIMHDPGDQGDLTIQCERSDPADDLMTQIQFVEEGWELKQDHEGMDTEQDEGNIFEMPTFVAEEFFTEGNDWSAACRSFLINEHNDRTGLKGIVFRATIDHNRKSGFDCLSNEEMYFHLLSAIIHHNSSQNESINICSMLEHTTIREDELFDSTKNILFLSLEKQVRIALDATLPESVIIRIHELELHQMKVQSCIYSASKTRERTISRIRLAHEFIRKCFWYWPSKCGASWCRQQYAGRVGCSPWFN